MIEDNTSWLGRMLESGELGEIRRARREAADAAFDSEMASNLAKSLQRRVDRLELVCETLLEVVLAKKLVSREELGVLFAQVDLRDGREDGGLDMDNAQRGVPTCGGCARPVNPGREACVYCGAPLTEAIAPKRVVRLVGCGGCGQEVDERETNFTEHGLRCDRCFRGG